MFHACTGGATSAPNRRTSSRLRPRSGPKPPPRSAAEETAAPQSTFTPSRAGVTSKRWFPETKTTGTCWSFAARRSSSDFACAGVIPPTSIPATLTPFAILPEEPANAKPTMLTSSISRTAISSDHLRAS